jgi:glycolate oxidase iron-sulfur subunit
MSHLHASFPLELADRCVKCGLCLPHCPTYGLMGVEGESPRGRIALMQGLALGRLEPGAALASAPGSNCLGCRACEKVCPAGVPYGELIDAGRALLVRARHPGPRGQGDCLGQPVAAPALLRMAVRLARLPGARQAARRLGALRGARALAAARGRPPPQGRGRFRRPGRRGRGEALLFAGLRRRRDRWPERWTTRVSALAAAGWRVRMPERQGCCGALDLHAGRPGEARRWPRATSRRIRRRRARSWPARPAAPRP